MDLLLLAFMTKGIDLHCSLPTIKIIIMNTNNMKSGINHLGIDIDAIAGLFLVAKFWHQWRQHGDNG